MTALKSCPTCEAEYPSDERFCPRDGSALRTLDGDLVGSIVSERYHVVRKLGEGGMGTVYLAEHVKMGRQSALKVLNPELGSRADAIGRFNREAANASRVNHPNVAGIYDFGETADGLLYIAMEYVEGEPLTEIVARDGPLPPWRAAEIIRQAAEGLTAAHELGIVHRDLKPDNIMVAHGRDGADLVKVVDFGIAKAASVDAQKVTRTGLVIGTPEYMSPEQLAGDPVDARSDVYALALVAFHLLTGQLAFAGETAQESMIMRLTERPRTLAERRPERAWTPAVQAVMSRALERVAAERYASAVEFGRALVEAVRGMPVTGEAETSTQVMDSTSAEVPATRVAAERTPGQRGALPTGRARVAAVVAAMLLLVVLLLVVLPLLVRGRREPAAAPSPASPASVESTAADTAADGASAPGAGATAAGDGGAVSYMSELRAIDRRAEVDSTARRALGEADTMRGRVMRRDETVYLAIIRAQAFGTMGQDARSCEALRKVVPIARQTSYATKLAAMLANCP